MNRLYLSANLSRKDYFKRIQISGTGDVSVAGFYAASSCVLILLFSILSVSEYLIPWNQGMRECLDAAGIGPWKRVVARVIGLGVLIFRGNHLWGDDSCVEKLDVDIRRFTVKFFSRDGVAVSYGCEYSCIW